MNLSYLVGQTMCRTRARRIAAGAAALLIPLLLVEPGTAQNQGGGFSIDQIKQMLQGHSAASQLLGNGSDQSSAPQEIILQPSAPPATDIPTSRLEQVMSTRAGIKLKQFGYDQFGVGRPVSIPQMGAVQDDYILGPGDEIDVSLRGQQNAEYQATVGRDGRVILPSLNPISAAGRTFGDFRRDLLNAAGRAYLSTKAFVSISRLREISVLVTGEVNNPGARIMTGLSTAADAIVISGGIRKTGSLRAIRVVRDGRSINVDLYNLITQRGNEHTVHLADGDRIIVPPLGRSVAVSGWVRLPGIFELSPGTSSISVRSLASLAGGFEVRGKYRLSVLRQESDGQSRLTKVDERSPVKDGEILSVQPAAEQTTNQAELAGGMSLAGRYAITDGMKLSDLIRQPGAIGNSPDTTFGIISRRDASSYIRHLIPFTPAAVLRGAEDMPLQTADVVRVFSTTEAHMLRDSMRRFRQFKMLARSAARDPQGLVTSQATTAELLPSDSEFLDQLGYAQAATATNPPLGNGPIPGVPLIPPGTMPTVTQSQLMANPNGPLAGTFPAPGYPGGTGAGNAYPGAGYANGANPYSAPPANGTPNYPGTANNGNPTPPYQGNASTGVAGFLPGYPGNATGNPVSPLSALQSLQSGALGMPAAPPSNVPQGVLSNVPPGNLEEQSISGTQVPTNEEAVTFTQAARQLSVEPTVFANFLLDHSVVLSGAVRGPGVYFAGPSLTLDTLIDAAGGASSWADGSAIDVISTSLNQTTGTADTAHGTVALAQVASYIVRPHDEFHVREVYSDANFGSVTLQGEIRSAGDYQITRGEHLSQLLARAGGLTDIAYPYGTVFLRRSAANIEAQGYQRAADEVQSQLIGAMTRVTTSPANRLSPNDFGALQTFVNQLRTQKPLGRISVVADPALLKVKPGLDPLLEPGDVIYIPQRPSTVTVLGQVLQPGSFPYEKPGTVQDYLDAAGGYAQYADESTTFVVLPDGKAEKIEASWFNIGNRPIPPGSTIVVPRDLAPYDTRQLVLDVTQIFSQLAVVAASLAVLSNQ